MVLGAHSPCTWGAEASWTERVSPQLTLVAGVARGLYKDTLLSSC